MLREIFDGSLREKRDPKAAAIREFGWAIRRNRETRTSGNFRPSLRTCIGCGIRLERVVTSRNGLKTFTTGPWKHVSLPLPWCRSVPFHGGRVGLSVRFRRLARQPRSVTELRTRAFARSFYDCKRCKKKRVAVNVVSYTFTSSPAEVCALRVM